MVRRRRWSDATGWRGGRITARRASASTRALVLLGTRGTAAFRRVLRHSPLERASERPRPAAYKIQIVCPPLRCVPRSFSSVGLGRGRSFRRLSFKQKNHLFRWWVPFVFWNFLAGPTARAGGDTKSEPVYLEGTEGKGSDRAGRRQGRKLLARSRCNRSGGRGRRTGKRRTARNCGIVVEAGNCGQMNAHAGDGGRAERGGRGMMMGRAGVDVDEGEAHGLGHQGRERRVVSRLLPPPVFWTASISLPPSSSRHLQARPS